MYALPTHEVCQIFMRIFRPRLCWHTLHGRITLRQHRQHRLRNQRPVPLRAEDGLDPLPSPWLLMRLTVLTVLWDRFPPHGFYPDCPHSNRYVGTGSKCSRDEHVLK